MTDRCECGGCLPPRKSNRGPAPRLCDDCRAKNKRDAKRRWWANNPGMSREYSRDRRLRARISSGPMGGENARTFDRFMSGEINLGALLAGMSGREE
jgi:hypothetical protein